MFIKIKPKSSNVPIVSEIAWVVVGQVVSLISSLLLVKLLTNDLSLSEYGDLTLGLTIASLVNQLIFGGLGNGVGRYYSIALHKNQLNDYYGASVEWTFWATKFVLVLSLFLIFYLYINEYYKWVFIVLVAVLLALINGYSGLINSVQNAARKRKIVATNIILESILKIFIVIIFLWIFNNYSYIVLLSFSTAAFITLNIQWLRFKNFFSPSNNNRKFWKEEIMTYTKPFLLWGIFTWAQQSSDRWALQLYSGSDEVGLYAAVYQIGYAPISLAIGALMAFLGPIFFQKYNEGKNIKAKLIFKKILTAIFVLISILFLLTFYYHEQIFLLFTSGGFQSASKYLPWMILAGGLFACGQLYALELMSEMRSSLMTLAKIGTAILGCIFNIIGAALYGLPGVVFAQLAFSILFFGWMKKLVDSPFKG